MTTTADAAPFTVVGVWMDNKPRAVGVIAGHHQVTGGEDYWGDDVFAEHVTAADAQQGEALAIKKLDEERC